MVVPSNSHRLKLVTGVDISTRPVRRSGSEGNAINSTNRRATAEPNRNSFRRSRTMPRNHSSVRPVCKSAAIKHSHREHDVTSVLEKTVVQKGKFCRSASRKIPGALWLTTEA